RLGFLYPAIIDILVALDRGCGLIGDAGEDEFRSRWLALNSRPFPVPRDRYVLDTIVRREAHPGNLIHEELVDGLPYRLLRLSGAEHANGLLESNEQQRSGNCPAPGASASSPENLEWRRLEYS